MTRTLDTAHVIIDATDHAAIRAVLDARDLSGTAPAVADYEHALAEWFGTDHAVACSSGTAALHLALQALDVKAGDEVIVAATAPALTAMPILAVGARAYQHWKILPRSNSRPCSIANPSSVAPRAA